MVDYNYEATRNRRVDKDQFIQRIDFVESSQSSWFGRYSWGDESELQPEFYLNGSQTVTTVHQAMFSNTRLLSPSKVNEFRFGFNSFYNLKAGELANTRDVMSELNIPGISKLPPVAWGTPEVIIVGFTGLTLLGKSFGDLANGPYLNRNRTYQAIDNFSWTKGKHSLRFGGELRWDQYNQLGNQFARGQFRFEPNAIQSLAASRRSIRAGRQATTR